MYAQVNITLNGPQFVNYEENNLYDIVISLRERPHLLFSSLQT